MRTDHLRDVPRPRQHPRQPRGHVQSEDRGQDRGQRARHHPRHPGQQEALLKHRQPRPHRAATRHKHRSEPHPYTQKSVCPLFHTFHMLAINIAY